MQLFWEFSFILQLYYIHNSATGWINRHAIRKAKWCQSWVAGRSDLQTGSGQSRSTSPSFAGVFLIWLFKGFFSCADFFCFAILAILQQNKHTGMSCRISGSLCASAGFSTEMFSSTVKWGCVSITNHRHLFPGVYNLAASKLLWGKFEAQSFSPKAIFNLNLFF